ncbi:YraN family protein [Limimaricola pyoseonensis]|uniref:YraN family protein n=1 Tax=Limimaricola pyoseonensis TaxID=521013 RepID=UPI001F617DE3|nr:YraN family protein [Limimaricola pyoseonensis]
MARHYARSGRAPAHRRWRGPSGEIDLVLREGPRVVFVEVKASRSFDAAIAHLGPRQARRIRRSAAAFCEGEPAGVLTEMRFDLALVNRHGAVRVIENAFGHD